MPTILYRNKQGDRIPGTTTIISSNLGWNKQPLMYWAWKQGTEGKNFRDTTQEAADSGTVAHYLIDCHLHNKKPEGLEKYPAEIISKAETAFINFLTWCDMVKFRVFSTEINLVSEKYQYGATPDLIAWINDKLCLCDYKTGSDIYADHLIQAAAYEQCWNENNPDNPITGGYHGLRFDKETAGFDHKHRIDLSLAWEAFELLLKLHKLQKKIK
jgi:hypothetical protein